MAEQKLSDETHDKIWKLAEIGSEYAEGVYCTEVSVAILSSAIAHLVEQGKLILVEEGDQDDSTSKT